MKIELGKKYLNKAGQVVKIICVDACNNDYPVIGLDQKGHPWSFTAEGLFNLNPQSIGMNNLVSEYIEPKEPNWVYLDVHASNIDKKFGVCCAHSQAGALDLEDEDTIALIKIDPKKLKGLKDFTELVPKEN